MQPVGAHVLPCEKPDAADDDQRHDDHVDQRIVRVGGQRGVGHGTAQQVEPGVAERGHRMKQSIPQPPDRTVFLTEHRGQQRRARQLDQHCGAQDEARQLHDAADVVGGDGLLHGAALHQADPSARNHRDDHGDGHHPPAADLDQHEDHGLSEGRPIGGGVVHHQSGHAHRRGGREQRVQRFRAHAAHRGAGQTQQQPAQQDHAEKAHDDDLRRGQMEMRLAFVHDVVLNNHFVALSLSHRRHKNRINFRAVELRLNKRDPNPRVRIPETALMAPPSARRII